KRARELFQQDAELADYFNHKLAGGKWNHMMDQTHIGYTGWQQPESNSMPRVIEITNAPRESRSSRRNEALTKSPEGSQSLLTSAATVQGLALTKSWRGFVEAEGYGSIKAEHFA